MRNRARYPAPVRAIGSNHSTTRCGVADGGTMILMRRMNRVIEVGDDFITAQGGALYIDVAKTLQGYGRQFHVNVALANLTIGSAACGGTKDVSMPGEFGQVSSYQTRGITPEQARHAFGERLVAFEVERARFDPSNRPLNEYFADILSQARLGGERPEHVPGKATADTV